LIFYELNHILGHVMASSSVQVNMEHSYGCAVRDSDGATFLHVKRLREH